MMLDIVWKCDKDNKVVYVWFDTGLEYEATKRHIRELEEKYGIKILTYKAKKPIPTSCRKYGQPFLSKIVSENIHRLQIHNFKWEDKPYGVLLEEYPNCKSALGWWCNKKKSPSLRVDGWKYLKEFLSENPPQFKISNKCCDGAKKEPLHDIVDEFGYDLSVCGIRKAEGGARATRYKSCFDDNGCDCDNYRPLFWYKNEDKQLYVDFYGIKHSDCYLIYGLKRTGCAGCPFGRDFEYELEVIRKYEPKLYVAVNNIFRDSYAYTRQYREFRKKKEAEEKKNKCGQMDIFDFLNE